MVMYSRDEACPFGTVASRRPVVWLFYVFGLCSSQSCPPSSYANSSEPPLVCLPCQTCSPGEGAASPCEGTNDTVCAPCKENHYSKLTAIGRECIKCESCGEERSEVSPCTATQNAVCGSCAPGYFLYIDNGGSVCEQCSKCPADRVVVHWIECAEASRPLDQQCAPGEWTDGGSSTTPLSLLPSASGPKTTHQTPTSVLGRTRLPFSHGTFLPMAGYSLQGQDNPSSFSVEKIGIVSVVFTGVTFVTFVISAFIICFLECRDKPLCKRCNFSTKRFSTAVPEDSPSHNEDRGPLLTQRSYVSNISTLS